MSDPAVHWHEGMFLRPHHFQAAERHWRDQLRWSSQWDRPYHWGIQDIRLDPDAMKASLFKVQRLHARLRDGTIVRVPADGVLPDRNLRDLLTGTEPVEVSLAVPVLQLGRPNLGDTADGIHRYRVETNRDGVEDENDGRAARPFVFRRLNLRLLVGGEDPAGYEILPLARVERSGQVGAVPQLAPSYIPPLLGCDAWKPLRDDIVLAVANRVSSLVETYGKRVRGKIRLGSNDPQDVLTLEKFRILNETHTFFGVLAEAAGVHPFDMYLEMCRLLGRLAVLGKDSPTFDPPRYDHDDLGTCFNRVKQYIDELLGRDFDMEYEQEPFVGIGLALKAPFKPAWLAPSWQMYVGVESSLPSAECARYLTGKLNMKIAAYGRVEEVFRRGLRGLEFKYVNNQPRVLPSGSDMTYFQINRDATKDEWVHVQNALDIAVRLNEHLILESLQDKTEFSLRFDGGKPVRMAFTLYVVPPSSQTTA